MMLCPRIAALFTATIFLSRALYAQEETLHYAGTVGRQHVTLTLGISGGQSFRNGYYNYDGQKSDTRIVDSRQFGTTIVLQDEDGSILHLHFESADGDKVGSFSTASMLEGTLNRAELDLPVKLKRVEALGKP